jgi:hypothetical protein
VTLRRLGNGSIRGAINLAVSHHAVGVRRRSLPARVVLVGDRGLGLALRDPEVVPRVHLKRTMLVLRRQWPFFARSRIVPFWEDQLMSSEVPIEIEDRPTAVTILRELVEHLQDTIEALKREIVRNPKSDEYRKALKSTGERLNIAKQILAREEARAPHS